MKKYISFFIAVSLIISSLFFTGCSLKELPTPKISIVLFGKHSNSMQFNYDDIFDSVITNTYNSLGEIYFISIDGYPEVLTQTEDGQELFVGSVNSKEKKKYDKLYSDNIHVWETQFLDEQKNKIKTEIENLKPNDDETNLVEALFLATELLDSKSYNKETIKEIVICDTGLTTKGPINFLEENYSKLLYNGNYIESSEEQKKELLDTINTLENQCDLPDLKDVVVTWYGIGNTAAPQDDLTNLEIKNLQYFWKTFLNKCGAKPPVASDDYFISYISTKSYKFPNKVTPIVNLTKTISLSEKLIAFKPSSDEYQNESEALKILEPIAKNMNSHPTKRFLLIGTTSSYNGGSVELSKLRADRIKSSLTEFGVSETQLDVTGVGYDLRWCKNDSPNGTFDETIGKENRAVLISEIN